MFTYLIINHDMHSQNRESNVLASSKILVDVSLTILVRSKAEAIVENFSSTQTIQDLRSTWMICSWASQLSSSDTTFQSYIDCV